MSDNTTTAPASVAVSKLTDGTLDAPLLLAPEPFGRAYRMSVRLPKGLLDAAAAGRYFLVRCGASTLEERLHNWQFYLRKPLFPMAGRVGDETGDVWDLLIPDTAAPGYQWLLSQPAGTSLNLIGPLGNGFTLGQHVRNLLLVGRDERVAPLLPLMDAMLDRGGRVTLLLVDDGADRLRRELLPRLPIAVEVHIAGAAAWTDELAPLTPWADQICAALPNSDLPVLANTVREARLRFDPGLVFVLPDADLACGYGACLACVVPTAGGGFTRACVNGPVFDLQRLV